MNHSLMAIALGEKEHEQSLAAIGRAIGYGRAQQILGQLWEAAHDCAPRGRMGVSVPVALEQAQRETERLRIEVRQADERGDEAMRRAHAAEAEVERLRPMIADLEHDIDVATASDAQTQALNAELLEALKLAVAVMDACPMVSRELLQAVQTGRAAIAKAGGAA